MNTDSTKIDYDKLFKDAEEAIPEYYYEANQIFGLVLITVCAIILSSNHPKVLWIIFIPLTIGLMYKMFHRYPEALSDLRKIAKKNHNIYNKIQENEALKSRLQLFDKKHFGWKALFTENIIYLYGFLGYIFLGVVLFLYPEHVPNVFNLQ